MSAVRVVRLGAGSSPMGSDRGRFGPSWQSANVPEQRRDHQHQDQWQQTPREIHRAGRYTPVLETVKLCEFRRPSQCFREVLPSAAAFHHLAVLHHDLAHCLHHLAAHLDYSR